MARPGAAMRRMNLDPAALNRPVKPGTARRALGYARPFVPTLLLFLVVVIANAAITVANPLISRHIVNDGIQKGNVALIVHLALLVAVVGIVDAALGLMQTWMAAKIGAEVVLSLRRKLFVHVQQMPIAFFGRIQTGALVNRLVSDAMGARSAFTDVLSTVVGNTITVLAIIGTMFALSWRITVVALVLVPLFMLPARLWSRRIQAITREGYEAGAAMSSVMVERFNVAGATLSRLFGRPQEDARAFEARAQQLTNVGIKGAIYGRMFGTMLLLMATTATAVCYGWGGVLAARKVLDLGTVVAFVALLGRMYFPLMGLSNLQVSIMTALVSFERIFEVLDLAPMITEKPDAVAVPPGPLRVQFEHVSFRYPTAAEVSLASLESIAVPERKTAPRTVLQDIDFTVEPGRLVALVGPSGAGKSTLTMLIPRLYDVQAGRVRLNGVDVRDAQLASVQQRIGVVTQEAHLFHDTLRANLQYARPGATDAQIREALRDAQILETVDALPNGLDTMVGERGYRFSGGEKQRLAIARLLLKAPDLVVLDEATAHLDSNSEAAVQAALERALAGRTAIVIAHRLSTVLRADLILVVQEGRIVERGTHAELVAAGGLYAQLYQRQFAEQSAG
ncbi:MAG TPA: ABC transporter ATP-binding protein [Steroidobacteraceae bacterium]|nr:ABC transporter ATP-binding protein [Steroidobacteraceae bacterium]